MENNKYMLCICINFYEDFLSLNKIVVLGEKRIYGELLFCKIICKIYCIFGFILLLCYLKIIEYRI